MSEEFREMERQERLTQQQRTVVQVLLLAVELGDESAVSRLIANVAQDEESTGGRARNPAAAGQVDLRGLIEGLDQFVAGLKGQIAVSQAAVPGFQFPVGQVTVRRRGQQATKDGHGDKSRRRQVLA